MLRRVSDPDTSLLRDIAEEMERRGGADAVLVASTHGSAPEYHGKTVSQLSVCLGLTPAETVAHILARCSGTVSAIYFSMSQEDVHTIMCDMHVAIGSDAPPSLFRIHRACPALTLATLQPSPFSADRAGAQTDVSSGCCLQDDRPSCSHFGAS